MANELASELNQCAERLALLRAHLADMGRRIESFRIRLTCAEADALTPEEFQRITEHWEATESRRCELIGKRIKSGRTAAEETEFRQLQRLLMWRRRLDTLEYHRANP